MFWVFRSKGIGCLFLTINNLPWRSLYVALEDSELVKLSEQLDLFCLGHLVGYTVYSAAERNCAFLVCVVTVR